VGTDVGAGVGVGVASTMSCGVGVGVGSSVSLDFTTSGVGSTVHDMSIGPSGVGPTS
jgi:hypothetical protein